MTIGTIQILAASDWEAVIKVLAAIGVLAAGAIGSYIKSNSENQSAPDDDDSPTERPATPRRVQPQYPKAQPMPDQSTPRPVIVQRQEEPRRPVVTRPTAPPVIAASPMPTIRRTPPPAPRPTPQPVSQTERPAQVQKRRVAKPQSRLEPAAQARNKDEASPSSAGEKRQRNRLGAKLESQLSSQAVAETRPTRLSNETLRLSSKEDLRNAFVLSEILGPPLSLRPIDEPLW